MTRYAKVPEPGAGPNAARIYDYLLGGKDNYAQDRDAAEELLKVLPAAKDIARANRWFLGSAVQYLAAEVGIDQFLDIGSGLPTESNTHQVAQRINRRARVVYVDHDPMVTAHARMLASGAPGVDVVEADMHDVTAMMEAAAQTLNLQRPVGVMLVAVLHFTPHARDIMADLKARLPAGSHVVFSHIEAGKQQVAAAADLYQDLLDTGVPRNVAEIMDLLKGLDLVPPGLVPPPDWKPGTPRPEVRSPMPLLAAVGSVRP